MISINLNALSRLYLGNSFSEYPMEMSKTGGFAVPDLVDANGYTPLNLISRSLLTPDNKKYYPAGAFGLHTRDIEYKRKAVFQIQAWAVLVNRTCIRVDLWRLDNDTFERLEIIESIHVNIPASSWQDHLLAAAREQGHNV